MCAADGHPSSGPRSASRDFSALQQHIDELTQQKFELARGLEGQRKVAETLASENQALTDDFNRQVCTTTCKTASHSLHLLLLAQEEAHNLIAPMRQSLACKRTTRYCISFAATTVFFFWLKSSSESAACRGTRLVETYLLLAC